VGQINWTIDVGHLLTVGSLLISVIALLIAWRKDRRLRERDQAARVRAGIVAARANLQLWRTSFSNFAENLQLLIPDTCDSLGEDFDVDKACRVFLKGGVRLHGAFQARIGEERLELPPDALYMRLDAYETFAKAINDFIAAESEEYQSLMNEIPIAIVSTTEEEYDRRSLETELARILETWIEAVWLRIDAITDPADDALSELIFASDAMVLRRSQPTG
jgi:hypothetical protein